MLRWPFASVDRYRIADLEFFPAGDGRRLVRLRGSATAAAIDDGDARRLVQCLEYSPLDELTKRWAVQSDAAALKAVSNRGPRWLRRLAEWSERNLEPPEAKLKSAETTLRGLIERGLLTSESEFRRELAARPEAARSAPKIASVGFTTRNRPVALRRALASYAENLARWGRDADLVVIDDARDEAEERATEAVVEEVRLGGAAIRWAGRDRRERFIQRIADRAGVDPRIVRFALAGDPDCPVTTGAARNRLLLDSAGAPYVLADDDGVCRLTKPPDPDAPPALSSQTDPTEFRYFTDREETLASVEFAESDLLAEHEALLGAEVAALVAAPRGVALAGASPLFERRLRRTGGYVAATMAGIVGDSGIGATGYLFVHPANRARLLASEERYWAALRGRQVLRRAERPTVADSMVCMAGNLGVDASRLAPPFIPVQRNSDGLFARLLRVCFERSCLGYLATAVLHDPLEAREQSIESWWRDLERMRFSDVVVAVLRGWRPAPGLDGAAALTALGDWFSAWGELPTEEFHARLLAEAIREHSPRLDLDRSREAESMPEFYARLRRRQLDVMREALARPGYTTPRDLLARVADETAVRDWSRRLIASIGAMLRAWPAIWEAARGERLAE